jgi:hypothetical protein
MIWREWISQKGLSHISLELSCSYETVRSWVYDNKTPGKRNRALLLKLAERDLSSQDMKIFRDSLLRDLITI